MAAHTIKLKRGASLFQKTQTVAKMGSSEFLSYFPSSNLGTKTFPSWKSSGMLRPLLLYEKNPFMWVIESHVIAMAATVAEFSVQDELRLKKQFCIRQWFFPLWLPCLGGAGCEYYGG